MPPRRSEVESKMASSILYEKLAESVRKYPALHDKRCTDKLKKTLAWKDMAKELGPKNRMFYHRRYKQQIRSRAPDFKLFAV